MKECGAEMSWPGGSGTIRCNRGEGREGEHAHTFVPPPRAPWVEVQILTAKGVYEALHDQLGYSGHISDLSEAEALEFRFVTVNGIVDCGSIAAVLSSPRARKTEGRDPEAPRSGDAS